MDQAAVVTAGAKSPTLAFCESMATIGVYTTHTNNDRSRKVYSTCDFDVYCGTY